MASATALAVRCLGCGSVYVKPLDGTAPAGAHACPGCDYVGWVPAGPPLRPATEPPRSFSDPLLHPPRRAR